MLSVIDEFFETKEEPAKSCFIFLRKTILSHSNNITEHWKYGLPFYYYNNKPFCYLWKDKKTGHPYIGIVRSDQFEHPSLFKGDRKKMKILQVNPNQDFPKKTIKEILLLAEKQYQ